MEKIYLDKEFERFWSKIENNENFAFMRHADGEKAIMLGQAVAAQEGNWKSPNFISKLGKDIYDSLFLVDEKAYYAISCPCCDNEAYYWFSSRMPTKNLTFANLWINANYKNFLKKFDALQRDAILIANYRAEGKKFGNLNILKHYHIDDDCISFWENNAPEMIKQIQEEYGNQNDMLYVVSAGPMSGPIIAELFKHNPNNCYVDFGSSIDGYYREGLSRPYMTEGNMYAVRNCWMYNPYKANFDVSVVLNLYKRPHNLALQLEALEKQSLKPKEILLYQDGTADTVSIPEELKNSFNIIEISPENKGVWARFDFARRKANYEFVCVFDDDTICSSRWLENCHTEMMKEEGLYGTIGIMIDIPEDYPFTNYFRVGWDGNLDRTIEVDLVGHSWFFKKDWLEFLFRAPKELQELKYVAEDMSFSFMLQKEGIKTFVPPHPKNQLDFFGSDPTKAFKLGISEGCLSHNDVHLHNMKRGIEICRENCWKLVREKSKDYYYQVKAELIAPPLPHKEASSFTKFAVKALCLFVPVRKWRKRIRKAFKV